MLIVVHGLSISFLMFFTMLSSFSFMFVCILSFLYCLPLLILELTFANIMSVFLLCTFFSLLYLPLS